MVGVYVDDADITLLAGKTESDLDRGTALSWKFNIWRIDLDILPVDQDNAKLNRPGNSHIKPRLLRNTSQRTHAQLSNSSWLTKATDNDRCVCGPEQISIGSLLYSLHMTGHFIYRIAGIFRGYKFSRMDLYKGFCKF